MAWEIVVYETNRKEKPVEEFVKAQNFQTKSKIIHLIDLLQKHGPILGMPHSKKLISKLYELRIRGKQETRILYCFKKEKIYLLHAFKKQTQKTPRKEMEIALKRLLDVI